MTGILKIIKPGINTTIQDHGRLGYQKYGISTSGVMDKFLATVTNALVGNDCNAAVLEMAYIGAVIEVVDGRTKIAIGGKVDVEVLSDNNFYPRPFNSFEVKKGDVIKTHASIKKINKKINFKPEIKIAKGIKSFIDWYKVYYTK